MSIDEVQVQYYNVIGSFIFLASTILQRITRELILKPFWSVYEMATKLLSNMQTFFNNYKALKSTSSATRISNVDLSPLSFTRNVETSPNDCFKIVIYRPNALTRFNFISVDGVQSANFSRLI